MKLKKRTKTSFITSALDDMKRGKRVWMDSGAHETLKECGFVDLVDLGKDGRKENRKRRGNFGVQVRSFNGGGGPNKTACRKTIFPPSYMSIDFLRSLYNDEAAYYDEVKK